MAVAEAPPTVAVIGGGFSGLLTAIHLLRQSPDLVVRLVERAPRFGRGRAYQTAHPDHLLNVRAANMSAFPDQPDHFRDWLAAAGVARPAEAFVSRGRYGDYLQSLLRDEVSDPSRAGRLLLEADEAVSVAPAEGRLRVTLEVGRTFDADAVVLALGLLPPAPPPGAEPEVLAHPAYVADPWGVDPETAPKGDLLLIGSGLTMVDVALSLAARRSGPCALRRRRSAGARRWTASARSPGRSGGAGRSPSGGASYATPGPGGTSTAIAWRRPSPPGSRAWWSRRSWRCWRAGSSMWRRTARASRSASARAANASR